MFCHSECKLKVLNFRDYDYRELQNIPSVDMCQSVCTSDPQSIRSPINFRSPVSVLEVQNELPFFTKCYIPNPLKCVIL